MRKSESLICTSEAAMRRDSNDEIAGRTGGGLRALERRQGMIRTISLADGPG